MTSAVELAAVLGAAEQAEARVFELVGRWVRSVPEPEAKVLLSSHSRHHGCHAVEIAEVVPKVPAAGKPVAALDEEVVDLVAGLETTVGRLVALVEVVLPSFMAATTLPPGPPVAEAPVTRVMRDIGRDHREAMSDLTALLARLVVAPAEREVVDSDLVALMLVAGQELRYPMSNHDSEHRHRR